MTTSATTPEATPPPPKWRRASGGGGGFSATEIDPPNRPGIFVPMKFHRRNGRRVIIAPNGAAQPEAPLNLKALNPTILGIARAYRWRRRVEAGEFASHEDLAKRLGLARSYISRVMRLTLLAPDIVEAFLEGREPSGLSLDKIFRSDLPADWPGQRKQLGFPAVE